MKKYLIPYLNLQQNKSSLNYVYICVQPGSIKPNQGDIPVKLTSIFLEEYTE